MKSNILKPHVDCSCFPGTEVAEEQEPLLSIMHYQGKGTFSKVLTFSLIMMKIYKYALNVCEK